MALDTLTLDSETQDVDQGVESFIDQSVKATIRLRITPDDLRVVLGPDNAQEDYIDHVGPQFADILEYRLQQIFNVDNLDSWVQVDFVQNRCGWPAEEVVSTSQEVQSVAEEVVDSVKEELKDQLANDSEFDWEDRYQTELFDHNTTPQPTQTPEPFVAA